MTAHTHSPAAATAHPSTYLAQRIRLAPKRHWSGRVNDRHFGHPTRAELTGLHAALGTAIRHQIANGATVHERLPWVVRQVPWVVAILDVAVLFSFCADVFNVDPLKMGEAPVAALAAVMLAILGGGVGFTWLAITGMRIRAFRTELGEVAWSAVGALTWVMIGVSGALLAALSMLMYARVSTEVLTQVIGSTGAAAGTLAAIFALLSVVANLAVVAVHALDGSFAARELTHAGKLLHRYEQLTDQGDAGGSPAAAHDTVIALQRG